MRKIVLLITFSISTITLAQPRLVQGVLLSENDGYPLPNGVVKEVGTENKVFTNLDGEFEMLINLDQENDQESSLEFSFVGYESKIVKVIPDESYYKVYISEIVEEIIIIKTGFNTQRRSILCSFDWLNVSNTDLERDTPKTKVQLKKEKNRIKSKKGCS